MCRFVRLIALPLAVGACRDAAVVGPVNPLPEPATIIAVNALPRMPLGAELEFTPIRADSIRARYRSLDGVDDATTPWRTPALSRVVVLGLLPNARYSLAIESRAGVTSVVGPQANYTTPPLPADLAELRMVFQGNPSSGYSLANIFSSDGRGYAVAFDALGSLRWYRSFSDENVSLVRQQKNGNFTVYVGNSNGFSNVPGSFVEITPAGDSVRTIVATGSQYTDPHELVTLYDPAGRIVADYLFGYDFAEMDRTPQGIDAIEDVAHHQVLRISGAGIVDTLLNAIDHWTLQDAIAPPPLPDLDHPNSIDFDLDGGVIVSYRSLNAIVKIDPATSRILWQLGGTRNEFRILADPLGGFDTQHTVRVLSNGHFLVFDNGWTHSPMMSRVVEYALDIPSRTATLTWEYRASPPVFNDVTGSAQRLANGNTVVGWTRAGVVDEVLADGSRLSRGIIELRPGQIGMPYRIERINNLYSYVRP